MVAYIISMSGYEERFLCIVAEEMAAHQERMLMQHRDRMLHRDRRLMREMEPSGLLQAAGDLVRMWREARKSKWEGVAIKPPAADFDNVKRYIEEGAPDMDAIRRALVPCVTANFTITDEQRAEALPSVVVGAKRIVLSVAADAI